VTVTNHHTNWDDSGNGKVNYLISHNVKCGRNKAISQFVLERKRNKIRYNFSCSSSVEITNDCLPKETQLEIPDFYGGLDKHDMNCPYNWVIQQFRMKYHAGDYINYSYRCCKTTNTEFCQEIFTYPTYDENAYKTFYLDRQNVYSITNTAFNRIKLNLKSLGYHNPAAPAKFSYKTSQCYIN